MPSKGNQILKFRCPPELVQEIRTTIMRRNSWSKETPWTLSDFLEIAAVEKIKKMARSRRDEDPLAEVEEPHMEAKSLPLDDVESCSVG